MCSEGGTVECSRITEAKQLCSLLCVCVCKMVLLVFAAQRRKSTDGPGCERQLCRSSGARRSVRELRRQSLNVEP